MGKPIGTVFVELDMDKTKYSRAQRTILKEAGVVTMGVEKNYKTLGIKSAAIFDAMRKQAENAYQGIKHSARATADDIVRAEKAKAEKIKAINSEQFGQQKTMLSKLKGWWMAVAVAVGLVAVAAKKLYNAIKEATLVAARFETLGVVMHVVGKNSGYASDEMDRFAIGLEKTGISMLGARQALTRMSQAQLDLTKSSELARIAQDSAVIGNINSTEAFNQLVYGIQSANVRVLRTIGINVSFEQSYQKMAVQLGRTAASFTTAEKSAIRMNAVIEKGSTIAGAYEAAMETAGKKLLSLERHFENLKTLTGQAFTPVMGEIVDIITEAVKGLNNSLENNVALMKFASEAMQPFADGVRGMVEVVTLATGGGERGFWAYFWGENKIDENKRMAEEALELAVSYKDEFKGVGAAGGDDVQAPVGGDITAGDKEKLGADFWQIQADQKYEILSNQYAAEQALEDQARAQSLEEQALDNELEKEYAAQEEDMRKTRLQKIIEDHEAGLAIIEERKAAEIDAMNAIAKGEKAMAKEKEKEEKLKAKIGKAGLDQAMNDSMAALKSLGKNNEAAFTAFKVMSIAKATMKGIESAQSAWAAGMAYGGPPLAAAFTAASIAVTASNIAQIASMTSGGGGGTPASGGSAGASYGTYNADPLTGLPEPAETEQLPAISVNIENYVDSEENRRNFAEWLNDFVEDKGGRLVASESQFAGALT